MENNIIVWDGMKLIEMGFVILVVIALIIFGITKKTE